MCATFATNSQNLRLAGTVDSAGYGNIGTLDLNLRAGAELDRPAVRSDHLPVRWIVMAFDRIRGDRESRTVRQAEDQLTRPFAQ